MDYPSLHWVSDDVERSTGRTDRPKFSMGKHFRSFINDAKRTYAAKKIATLWNTIITDYV